MPVNDGSNISIAGPRGGLTTTDPFQQASKLFSAMRRASGGSGGTNAAVAASLGLPPNAKIDWMLDPQSGKYVPVVGGTDELRKYNLAAAKQRRAIEAINSEKGAGIRAKLEGFGGMSAEKQASILNDIRTNDIPKLSKDAQVDGSDLITYGLADYSRMQKENAANVAKTGTGDILWDSLRIGARNFMDSVADIFSDSNEQLARANLRQQYIRDIQDNNAFLRNRALQQQEGAGFLDRFGWGELAATTGEFLAENAPVLAATALTGGAAGLAARGIGAAAANVGRASMLGSAIGGGLTGMPTQLGSAINEIAADNKMTEDQKLQALDEAYGPSLGAGAALGAVVMPFGQYISRGIGSGLARAGVGNSNVAKMVRSRRAGEALPTGTNNWDEAMAMARRNDILAENEAIANQRLYRGMLGRRLRDSAIEGSLLSGASQMATNAAVGNSLMENVGPATIGGAIGGALFTPFNRRTAMGVPDDVIGQRTAERQKLVDLFAARNAARGGEARSFDDQTIGAMEAWDALAGARGADVLSNATPMTPAQREAYLRQQSYDDLLLNRMMAHEQAMQARANNFGFDDIAADPFRGYGAPTPFGDRTATTGPRIIDRLSRDSQFNADWNRIAAERAAQSAAAREAALRTDFVQRSIFDVMPEPIPYTPPNRITRSVFTPEERIAQEWANMERARAAANLARQARTYPALYTPSGLVPVAPEPTPEFVRAQVERQYGPMTGSPYGVPSLDITRPVGSLPPAAPRAIGEDPSRNRWEGGAIPAEENPNDIRQQVVDTLAALRERRNNTELRNERLINTAIAQEYYFNRVRDQQFRRDFTIYEGEVLLENNPGVLPTNNYLPENVAAVVENLGEPRIAETMLDGTPATDQRPKPQRPYTKAITYVSSDDALRKFTGKLRGRESMIPRDVREEQMGWMNDILAAGTGKGRISAQGVLAKDVRDTLDKIVDAQTVDSAMRLDELLLTRLRGSEDTSLFNRAQRAAMQYVRNRIYANMDDYAYQNKLGRYGEIDANTPENTDPTGGGGSPTSGMGGTESAGAEPTVDNNLSNDSGRPADTAGVSEATAGQLPDSTVTDSAAAEERGNAGTKTPDSGKDTTLEGDSATKTAQQQTADGKRDTGDAARVDAATNPRTGSDRVEGSSEQGDDRNAADTGSNEQSGSRTEPEDGEPVEVEHTDDWPWDDPEYEEGARDEIRVDKKTGEIGFRLNRLYDNYGEWYSYGIRDMFVHKSQKADPDDGSSPTAYVTFKNANGDTYELSFDYYKKEGNTPAHWSETSENTPGIRIDPKGYVWVNLREVPEEMQRAASGFEARVEIRLTDDEGGDVAEGGFPILPEEYPIKATAESRPAPQTAVANPVNEQQVPQGDTANPTETPAIEPKGLSSAEEIAARQTNPDVVPTEGVDPENNEALAWAAQQEGNRTHVEDDDIMAVDADTLLRDERREVHVADRGYYGHDWWSTVDYPARILLDNLNGITPEMRRRLNAAERQSYEESAGIRPTQKDIQAAHKVIQENGIIDTRKAFQEDNIQPSPTITAKQSLQNHVVKKLQKAKQELPQLPIDNPAPTTESPSVFSERFSRTIADMEQQYTRNGHSLDNFIKGAASSGASAKRIIAKRNASDASWREDLRDDMAETAARLGIMRSTGLFGEVKRGSPLARKEEFFANNNIPLIEPNSEMAQHLKEYFGAMPARERKITQAIDYVLRDPTAQKMDIINHPERSVC